MVISFTFHPFKHLRCPTMQWNRLMWCQANFKKISLEFHTLKSWSFIWVAPFIYLAKCTTHSHADLRSLPLTPARADARVSTAEWQKPNIWCYFHSLVFKFYWKIDEYKVDVQDFCKKWTTTRTIIEVHIQLFMPLQNKVYAIAVYEHLDADQILISAR